MPQVDVSSRTEGAVDAAYADGHGLPLLVKYDVRHQQNTEGPVHNILAGVAGVRLIPTPPMRRAPACGLFEGKGLSTSREPTRCSLLTRLTRRHWCRRRAVRWAPRGESRSRRCPAAAPAWTWPPR